ncbi:MAG: hypothetical protein SWZ49_31015 [Cyanobacteriota bacterium]|nr:hypothetical protein [Cyanobacteriota bacterium]
MATETEISNQKSTREISPNIPSSNEITPVQISFAIIPVAFVTTLAFLFFKQIKHRKELYNQAVALKRLSSVPCYKCRFFDNNQQLPCAVQPTVALSEEAFNCKDYMKRKNLN